MLIPVFTVAENVELGHEQHAASGSSTGGAARREVQEVSERYGLQVPPDALVAGPAGRRPAARGDHQGADPRRPGADPRRADRGAHPAGDRRPDARSCGQLKEGGTSIVFITHKLREVRAVADRITVIRRGKVVGEAEPDLHLGRAGLDDGRSPGQARRSRRSRREPGDDGPRGRRTSGSSTTPAQVIVDGVTLLGARRRDLRPGRRPGQRPDRAHRGAGRAASPSTSRAGSASTASDITARSASTTSSDCGVGYVPEDRLHDGLIGSFSIAENLVLDLYDRAPFAKGIVARPRPRSGSNAERAGRGVRRPHVVASSTPRRPCPAATSRRSCSPASCPAR